MQETLMQQELADVDSSKIAAIQQKRTLAFVNHFVTTNVKFLNSFARTCENKLMLFEQKLEKVNATMVLLESKLSSIPEVNAPQTETAEKTEEISQNAAEEAKEPSNEGNNESSNIQEDLSKIHRPEYNRFLKMVQVGVPVQAVKLKVSLEGLDPNILDELLSK